MGWALEQTPECSVLPLGFVRGEGSSGLSLQIEDKTQNCGGADSLGRDPDPYGMFCPWKASLVSRGPSDDYKESNTFFKKQLKTCSRV